ncbi:hypothetical protein Tco_1110716 [Tanacetum coccineum]|uniref:Uncharacterized protein n=1 Tax=Tanacetum coccineum TaxID=301880 RepID=A0ABQ5ILN8_9ASTR
MLGAGGVQILEKNLDDLHSSREEDGTAETMDPQDLLREHYTLHFLRILSFFILPEGCDPLLLVDVFTHVKENIGRYLSEKAKEETARILRKARRRKRKYNNATVELRYTNAHINRYITDTAQL